MCFNAAQFWTGIPFGLKDLFSLQITKMVVREHGEKSNTSHWQGFFMHTASSLPYLYSVSGRDMHFPEVGED